MAEKKSKGKSEEEKAHVVSSAKVVKKPARKRTKKEKVSPLIREIGVLLETGKYAFGSRKAIVDAMLGKAKLFIVAERMDKHLKEDLERYAKKSGVKLIPFKGNSLELGAVCGKAYPISVISVYDAGKSKLLEWKDAGDRA